MTLLEQCQIWHKNDEYQKIIDTLEAIPAQERTAEMDSELARAYNNLADHTKPEGRKLLQKAIALLKPHEEYFQGDHYWNFRMGYSYFYLDQEGRALRYFEKALEARPGDEDTQQFIEWCKRGISLPQFWACFRERTKSAWEAFAGQEAQLRQIMDADENNERGAELVALCESILNLAFDEISFEMGFNGKKHELILTPEGDKVKLFELCYFQKHAPREVLKHWNILVGRQPSRNIGLRTDDGWDISGEDVQVWLEEQGENSFAISACCEKLLPMLREEEGRAWWMLTTLTDQVLGEIPHMRYIDGFDVLEGPRAEPSFPLSQLPDKLKERGLDLSCDPEGYLESYLGYKLEPNEDPEADWRLDTMVGSTCCAPLVNGYLDADNDFMDALQADGAAAGFFCYSLDTLREEKGTEKIFGFRDKLEEALTAGDGPEILTLTGVFTGFVLLSRGRTRGSSSGTCRKSGTSPWRNTTPAGKRPTTRWGSRWAICWPLSAWPTVLSPAARPTRKTTICGRMRSKQPGSTAPIFWWRCWAPTPTPMTRGTSWQVSPPMCWRTMWSSATGRPSASRRTTSTPSPAAPASACRRSR